VQAPNRLRRRSGQRDVDAIVAQLLVELAGGQLGGARAEQRLERLARLVGASVATSRSICGSSALRPRCLTRSSSSAPVVSAPAISAAAWPRSCSILSIMTPGP